ncbi:MAG: S8 family serine peptidase [Granulosicoccaceae bacterium]
MATHVPSTPKKIVTDTTFGRYLENLEPDLILITMTPERHALLTDMRSVPMNGALPPLYSDFIDEMNSKYGLNRVANWPLSAIDIFCVVFEVHNSETRETIVAALEQEPGIETAQIVQSFDVQSTDYNDPYLALQHGLHSIEAISSHQWSRGKGISIAVIDTGMDNAHPDLVFSSEATRNFVDSDEAGFRSDTHGTAVGGVIAANADNETGIVGIAPDATLLALKACWYTKSNGSDARCNSLTLAKAINYAIQQNVDIINLSLTGPPDPVLERLVQEALVQEIAVVGAIPSHEGKAFPVSIKGTIGVAMPGQASASLSAPGRRVISTMPNEKYDFFDGSSFSTAHISGLVALLRSLSPTLTPSKLLALLELTANPTTGAVNACRAVEVVRRLDGAEPGDDHCL